MGGKSQRYPARCVPVAHGCPVARLGGSSLRQSCQSTAGPDSLASVGTGASLQTHRLSASSSPACPRLHVQASGDRALVPSEISGNARLGIAALSFRGPDPHCSRGRSVLRHPIAPSQAAGRFELTGNRLAGGCANGRTQAMCDRSPQLRARCRAKKAPAMGGGERARRNLSEVGPRLISRPSGKAVSMTGRTAIGLRT
jgi:hypothetical protein